jgi:hypothetical protein
MRRNMLLWTGATVITVLGGAVPPALVPLIVGLLSGAVAYGRWRPVPRVESSRLSNSEAPRSATAVKAAVA